MAFAKVAGLAVKVVSARAQRSMAALNY